jgi:hypothetical protein
MWNIFNSTQIETAEPANVQALLATQFDDFGMLIQIYYRAKYNALCFIVSLGEHD